LPKTRKGLPSNPYLSEKKKKPERPYRDDESEGNEKRGLKGEFCGDIPAYTQEKEILQNGVPGNGGMKHLVANPPSKLHWGGAKKKTGKRKQRDP